MDKDMRRTISEYLKKFLIRDKKVIMNYPEGKEPSSVVCPNCGSNQWYEGPSGGIAVNVKCGGCGFWFNNTPFGLDFIGIKDNISEHKKIVWYCPKCQSAIYNLGEVRKYPTCPSCGKPFKVCWSYDKFPAEHCDKCDARFTCFTERGNF